MEVDLRAPFADNTVTTTPLPAFVLKFAQIELIVLSLEPVAPAVVSVFRGTVYEDPVLLVLALIL
jgi:hypothetical protein